jgi:hypothetical protein
VYEDDRRMDRASVVDFGVELSVSGIERLVLEFLSYVHRRQLNRAVQHVKICPFSLDFQF